MSPVKIVADSGCDLPGPILERYDVSIVPLVVQIGSDQYYHGQIDLETFWRRLLSERATTSGPSLGLFQQTFERLVNAGHEVVCITLTGRHSNTFNTAWGAAQEFIGRVRVVDSWSISLSMGLQVLMAAIAAQAGRSADEIVALVEELRQRIRLRIVLDTLEYARRGGRLARLMPILDRMCRALSIKPILSMVEGEFRFIGAARSLKGALRRIEDEVSNWGSIEQVAIAHVRLPELVEEAAHRLAEKLHMMRESILTGEAGPAFAVHAGPGAFGIVLLPKKAR
ncbi:MAG: DegV family protein [Anaerolineae bacterium]|nr:DegV family protein [Anaerolineae bacterium]MDW8100943.1 DegV family protein [Anaerolineae bacterium]